MPDQWGSGTPASSAQLLSNPASIPGITPGGVNDTSSGVHPFAPALGGVPSIVAMTSANPPVLMVWNANNLNNPNMQAAGIFIGSYSPRDRQQSVQTGFYPNTNPISWFFLNHPDWVSFQSDQKTIATEFGPASYITAVSLVSGTTYDLTLSKGNNSSQAVFSAGNARTGVGDIWNGQCTQLNSTTGIRVSGLTTAPTVGMTASQGDTAGYPLNVDDPNVLASFETVYTNQLTGINGYAIANAINLDNYLFENGFNTTGLRTGHYQLQTTLSSAISAGATTIPVASSAGIAVGANVLLASKTTANSYEVVTVLTVPTATSFTCAAIAHAYESGANALTWISQYLAAGNDPEYRADQMKSSALIFDWITTNFPASAMAINFSYDDSYPKHSQMLASGCHLIFDEQGWSNGNNAPPYQYSDATWTRRAQWLWNILNAGVGWLDANSSKNSFATLTTAEIQWALANYLLFKSNASWIWIGGPQEYSRNNTQTPAEFATANAIGQPTESYNQIGATGVYQRHFTAGLTLVNPSSTTDKVVSLPAATYKDLYGTVQGTSITLFKYDPARINSSAIVLLHV
jgi:hypothetical protein